MVCGISWLMLNISELEPAITVVRQNSYCLADEFRGYYLIVAVSGDEILEYLHQGHRLEQPNGCMDTLYEVMASCWTRDPHDRPVCHVDFGYLIALSLLANRFVYFLFLCHIDRFIDLKGGALLW